jgi:membrane protein DedA with SNARE-associated domain
MDLSALLFLAAILAIKEAGVPIPVPGDVLVIGAGVAATHGGLPIPVVVVVLIVATVVGGIVQFGLIRGRAREAVLRLLARVGLRREVVERGAARFRRGGAPTVAVARMTPGIRIVTIASSALAGLATVPFVAGLTVGNGVFLAGHFALGAIVGEPAIRLVSGLGPALVVVGVGLAAIGAVGWRVIARRRARIAGPGADGSARSTISGTPPGALTALDWTDACCPACLALAVIAPRWSGAPESPAAR